MRAAGSALIGAGLAWAWAWGVRKGQPKGKFWDALAYSKVVNWGRHFENTKFYVILNDIEASGIFTRRELRPREARVRGSPAHVGLRPASQRIAPRDRRLARF